MVQLQVTIKALYRAITITLEVACAIMKDEIGEWTLIFGL